MRLVELQQRRAHECRLTPDRALDSLDEAEAFLLERGLLTRTADCVLPSLFQACHEEPYAPDKPGFGQWPRTKYPWFGELGARGYATLAIHGGKSLLVAPETAQLLDPLCRAELERRDDDPLLRHLAEAGPSELDDLQLELGLSPRELKRLRTPLERCGAVVARSVVYEDPHRHTSELARWDQRSRSLPPTAGSPSSWSRASVRPSSRRSASCGAGSRGGRTAWSSAWSARAAWCGQRTVGSRRRDPQLRLEDTPAVARLELTINPHQVLTPEVVWHPAIRPIEREQRCSWVTELDGELVGFAWANFEWSVPTPGKGRFWIGVHPESRRRGIGSALYEQVLCVPARARRLAAANPCRRRSGRHALARAARLRAAAAPTGSRRSSSGTARCRRRAGGVEGGRAAARARGRDHDLYEICAAGEIDMPGDEPETEHAFKDWRQDDYGSPALSNEGSFVALDDGRAVSVAFLTVSRSFGSATTRYRDAAVPSPTRPGAGHEGRGSTLGARQRLRADRDRERRRERGHARAQPAPRLPLPL